MDFSYCDDYKQSRYDNIFDVQSTRHIESCYLRIPDETKVKKNGDDVYVTNLNDYHDISSSPNCSKLYGEPKTKIYQTNVGENYCVGGGGGGKKIPEMGKTIIKPSGTFFIFFIFLLLLKA